MFFFYDYQALRLEYILSLDNMVAAISAAAGAQMTVPDYLTMVLGVNYGGHH